MALLSIPLVAWGCKSDPTVTSDVGTPADIVASPQRVFVAQGDSEAVSVTLVDAKGNPVPGTFTLTPPASAAITVTQDTTQRLIYDANGVLVQPTGLSSARYIVTGVGFAGTTFQVAAGGITKTIQVSSFPTSLGASVSTAAPALGQVVTVTAPAGTFFRPSTTGTIPGGAVKVVGLGADSTTLQILIQPGSSGAPSFTNVGIRSDTSLTFTVPIVPTLSLAAVTAYSGTPSTTTPAAGAPVVLTGGSGFLVAPNASVTVGGVAATTITTSADSTQLTFVPAPGSSGAVVITGTVAGGFALGALPTGINVTAGAGSVAPAAGTGAFATAPTIPTVDGKTAGVVSGAPFGYTADAGGFGGDAQLFKIVLTEKSDLDIKLPFVGDGADLGVYLYDGTQAGLSDAIDALGGGTNNLESGTITLDPGTYYLALVYFQYAGSPTPASYYGLQITPHAAP